MEEKVAHIALHLGNRRGYRLRSNELETLTEDRSLPTQFVRRGELTRADAEARQALARLTRYVGMDGAAVAEVHLPGSSGSSAAPRNGEIVVYWELPSFVAFAEGRLPPRGFRGFSGSSRG